jgi:hypothetical protein
VKRSPTKVGPARPGGKAEARKEFRDFVYGDKVAQLPADDTYDDDETDSAPIGDGTLGETDSNAGDFDGLL